MPVLLCDPADLLKHIEPVAGQPLTFRTTGIGRPHDVTLSPYYRLHHQRFTVYWKCLSEADWQAKRAAIEKANAARKALQARIVDEVRPGEQQPETDHNLKGERSNSGQFRDRGWRDANGGWFSYEVKVIPDRPAVLRCTYWGSDSNRRIFDILVDGEKIAEQKLDNNQPDAFFDVEYPLAREPYPRQTAGDDQVPSPPQRHRRRPVRVAGAQGQSMRVLIVAGEAKPKNHYSLSRRLPRNRLQSSPAALLLAPLARLHAAGVPQPARPKLQFINGSSETIDIFWLKSDTERVLNASVPPGKDTIITTTLGHRFEVVGRNDKTAAKVISEVPVQGFRFDPRGRDGVPSFYTQSVSAGGFPIVASARVNPYALKEAAFIVNMMLAKRPEKHAGYGKRTNKRIHSSTIRSPVSAFPSPGSGQSYLLPAERSLIWESADMPARAKGKSACSADCGTSSAPAISCWPIV